MLTRHDLEAIRRIVREELASRRTDVAREHVDDEAQRASGDPLAGAGEHGRAIVSWMRGEPGSAERMHASNLVKARRELEHARAESDTRAVRRLERKIAQLEREGPMSYKREQEIRTQARENAARMRRARKR
jgi:hypothetical protein